MLFRSGGPGTFPGDPRLPYAPVTLNLHWQLHTRGFAGLLADDLHGFPLRTDRIVTEGFPLDALTSWPFAALGEPTGMWLWIVAVMAAVGAAGAWLGMRWWGTLGAGLVAGLGFQVSEALLREVAEGRPTQAFAAIFLPLALGLAMERRTFGAVLAGVCAGLGTIASWNLAPILVCAGLGPLVLGWFSGGGAPPRNAPPGGEPPGPPVRAHPGNSAGAPMRSAPNNVARGASLLAFLAALIAVVAPVAAWTYAGRGELPSFDLDPWGEAVLGAVQARPVDLAAARIYGATGVALKTVWRPILVLAAVATARRMPPRAWAGPVLFAAVCAILGLGAVLPGPAVMPWGWLQSLPGLSRLWWADRAWIGVGLAAALLAAGAPGGWKPVLAVALVFEAFSGGALPFKHVNYGPTPTSDVLALRPDVPFVLLPTGEGPLRADRTDLLDQVFHGRPMANGTRAVDDLRSSDAVRRGWSGNAGLRALLACEMGGGAADADRTMASDALIRAGLREVYVDPSYVFDDPAYGACVEGVLAGWERGEEPPLWRYRAR